MKNQDAFEKIWNHFVVKGGKQSVSKGPDGPQCLYRGPEGARCAVGVLLSNEVIAKVEAKYPKDWNSSGVMTLVEEVPAVRKALIGVEFEFLEAAQNVHDEHEGRGFKTYMRKELTKLAHGYGLDVPKAKK